MVVPATAKFDVWLVFANFRKTLKLKLATCITFGQLVVLLVAAVCFWGATVEAGGVGHRKHGPYDAESLRVRGQGRETLGSRVLDQTSYVRRNGGLHAVAEDRLAKGESADEREEERREARSLAGTELANGDDENGYAKKVVNSDTQGRGSIMAGHWDGQVRRRVVKEGGAASRTEGGGTDNMQGNPGAAAKNEANLELTNSEESEPRDEARHPTVMGEGESQTQGGAVENDEEAAQVEEREKLHEAGDEEPEEGVVEKGEKRKEEMEEEGTEEGEGTEDKEEEGTQGKEEEGTQGNEEEGTQGKEEENAEEENGEDEEERTEATAQEEEKEAEEERDDSLQPRRKRHQVSPLRTVVSGGGRKHQVGDRTGSRRSAVGAVGKDEEETDMDEEDAPEKKGEEATEEDGENTAEQEEEGAFREGQGDEHSLHPITRHRQRSRVRMSSSGDSTDRGDGAEQQPEEESRDETNEPGEGKEELDDEEEEKEEEEQKRSFSNATEERLGFGPPPSSALTSEVSREHLAASRNSTVVVNSEKADGSSGSNHSRGMGANELVGNGKEEDLEPHRVTQDNREGVGTTQDGEAKLTSDGKMVQWDSGKGTLSEAEAAELVTDKVEGGEFGTGGGEGNMDEQSELDDEEPGNLMEPVQKTFSGLHKKTRESVFPKMGQAKDLGVKIFEQTHSSLNEGLTPLLGKNYSPIVSTLIAYGMLLVPLIITIFIVERVRAVLSIQKLLLFANAYLTAYSVTLLCLAIVIGAEPMVTLQRSAWENYFLLQFLQALGYIVYLMLQLTNVILVFNGDTFLAKAIAIIQFGTAGAVGLHYYVAVWQRAMVDKPPRITSTAYLVYALIFFVLCQMARLRNSRRDAILSSDAGDKVL
ncbi:hypothetical protein CBR_g57642 [Chara braunii]|uniref:Uncharacterized protein n=1 Tax=Chara braunii TaxID=69332 RepID=A0A388MEA0_CHABU|nr:hypothetical protein CBR_g57642 [Chara braunii]|eukprot:GBG92884.1 hypothetical protein CBR_g57642 [Chara braunii]